MALNSMISFVYLLIILITSTPASSSLITHDEGCLALFEFKQSINILDQDYYTRYFNGGVQKLDSWKKTTISNTSDNVSDCCLWDGVKCSRNEGRVIELDLSESLIHGHLTSNSTLYNLVHLRKLNLSGNDFAESQIPSEIARLKQLKSLDLSDSGFNGEIPNEISHLIHLSKLYLSSNSLKLQTPNLFQNLTRLEELHLGEVDISSSVPRFLANFSSLTSISFRDCQLQGKFPVAILQLPKLKRLSLALNPDLTGSLPDFRNNTLLEYLNLDTTSFFGIVPDSISNLNHLVRLDLDDSFFSGSIPSSLSNLTQLTVLSLSQNNFTGPVPYLASLLKLTNLDLSENNFTGPVPYLASLLKLTNLDLSGNNFKGTCPSLANLSKLAILDLGENNFKMESEYGWIGKLENLKELYLDDMNIYQEILPSLANLTKLDVVSLSNNFIPGHLDTFLGLEKLQVLYLSGISVVTTRNYTDRTLPQLEELGLSSCGLKEFPSFLVFQKEMIVLQLDHNQIDGLIPVSFLKNNQETLFFIDLSHNNFTGKIPPLICQPEYLQLLDLSSNSLTGPLPTCLFSKSMLFINLSQNKLGGTILNTITHECQLRMLDLGGNQFLGQLPKSLANCTDFKYLDFGDNSFDGGFPYWLGSLTELQVLILSFNKFFGRIHDLSTSSSKFPKLQTLELSNNGFSGHLPDNYFKFWKTMKSASLGFETSISPYFPHETPLTNKDDKPPKILNLYARIDLSYNSFDGEIPQSLTELRGLGSLDLSNNRLTGHVLPSLVNLKNLISLDLSHNNLSGEIPPELVQLNFLSRFNVSFNNLEGRIPTGYQFNTFENNSYIGNPLLCGKPLSKDCQGSTLSTLPQKSDDYYESLFPSDVIDWVVILTGFGGGLVSGIILGNFVYGRYRNWFIEQFGMRKDTWVRPLSNKRRN
ncbi:receptor-like protein 6 [Rutidosis leptorrhynchoides]|uniref:receptor-like protein 6 n=1 Tax=Rutidosis leptorrhynchoides TaxID=125765 RepID=UPI003A9A4855